MPTRRSVLERGQMLLEREEDRRAREVARVYSAARRDIVSYLIDTWTGSQNITPGQAVDLLRRLALLRGIDERMGSLEQSVSLILRDILNSSAEIAIEQIGREIALLPISLRPGIGNFSRINAMMVEQFLPIATQEVTGIRQAVLAQLQRELQSGLIQGESFPNLVRRVMAATPTGEGPAVWRNGQLSAERMVRRTVITAENAAKTNAISIANDSGDAKLQKQAIASIGSRTTRTCLRVHGQIRDVGEPFQLDAEPRFARRMQHPAFHWNCRTSVAMYHPSFEGGGLNTANMQSSAQAEIRRRSN